MNHWKKFGAAAVAAAVFLGALPAASAGELAGEEIAMAKIEANKLVPRKKVNFVFRSRVEGEVTGKKTEDGEDTMTAEAYFLTPYCYVMNVQLAQGRTGRVDFEALSDAAKKYQIRLLLNCKNINRDALKNATITVRRGSRGITPVSRRYTLIQRAKGGSLGGDSWGKIGVVLDIAADDVDTSLPVEVTLKGYAGYSATFAFPRADGAFDSYDTKDTTFSWTPLYDSV